ncbi:MAG TPA: glycine betaine ABC transporter substrate-binding protein [Acidimicrobiia bacterium]|nr:glycine betaine ABC transporter substrate-binding protein [Acidimicrobiia bacterium]
MKKRIWLLISGLALVAVACGGGGAASEGDNPTINLVVNAWTASALNVEIAKQLIESELGNPVEIVSIDENAAMFTGLSDGTVDAVLELWPSGITADEQAFFDDGSVVNIGELGTIGKIGWFVPSYVIDDHPDLATWEGFADPANAALFATAETGDLGRFLGTDPSYSQYDEAIIANLDLPFQVLFSGSEPATVAELDARVAAQEPIVMYWWTPTAAVAKYDLINVLLPEYSADCYTDPAAIACDYPEDVLIKIASAQLADKDPEVLAFLEAFTITTEDQLSMLPPVEIEGEDAADVAAAWIADNEAVWSAWLG